MATPVSEPHEVVSAAVVEEFRTTLKRLEHRDWWLWGMAVFTLLLLSVAIGALAIEIEQRLDLTNQQQLEIAVRGMFGLVLLFSAFAVYQQLLIKRLRHKLAEQVVNVVRVKAVAASKS